jgi:hypothetical protein
MGRHTTRSSARGAAGRLGRQPLAPSPCLLGARVEEGVERGEIYVPIVPVIAEAAEI